MPKDVTVRIVETERELLEAYSIRRDIFVQEQGLFRHSDRDSLDDRAVHLVALVGEEVVGTVRLYEKEKGTWYGGRLAVRKRFRGRAGVLLVKKAVETAQERKAQRFLAYVQLRNVSFFKRNRWKAVGEVRLHRGAPHQLMEAELRCPGGFSEPGRQGLRDSR